MQMQSSEMLQSSASSVVLCVGFREHDHTELGVAIGKVAF